MNKPNIILLGGGGHCKSCIDVIEREDKYVIKGILDLPVEYGKHVLGYPVIGNDDDLPKLVSLNNFFLVTMGHLGLASKRNELIDRVNKYQGNLAVVKAPSAIISRHASIGDGTIIMNNCIINANAEIGQNSIINNGALIEHDVVVGNNCHISTGAIVNGDCEVMNNVFIGSGAQIKNNISITDNVIIGLGSVVVKSIKSRGTYVGNPVKKLE